MTGVGYVQLAHGSVDKKWDYRAMIEDAKNI